MTAANTVTVRILDKDYQVACPPEQESALVTSAKYLDKQMRNIRETGKIIGLERIAVMAALNISYELLQASEQAEPGQSDADTVKRLSGKVDHALQSLRQLEIG